MRYRFARVPFVGARKLLAMRLLFSFENQVPNSQADAEVFINTASAVAKQNPNTTLTVPSLVDEAELRGRLQESFNISDELEIVALKTARGSLGRQHLAHTAVLPQTQVFKNSDILYTRHLLLAMNAVRCGLPVVVDHYRPWGDQVPPFQLAIHKLMNHELFLGLITHSVFAKKAYLRIGVPEEKIRVIYNGYDPLRLAASTDQGEARAQLGLPPKKFIAVYTGRVNHKKGLDIVLDAAKRCPEVQFILVGSESQGPIEEAAANIENVKIVGWQPFEKTVPYLAAADVLLIPPSDIPLKKFGNTVLPLKTFLYLGAGRAIVGPATPDVEEIIEHDRNGLLVPPGNLEALIGALKDLASSPEKKQRLSEAAQSDGASLTWDARASKILRFIEERYDKPLVPRAEVFKYGRWLKESALWAQNLAVKRNWVTQTRGQ